ncbi:MAG: two-component system, HptB-dependent secretion and biofilm response regulator [Campylobacterota bacterium]|nr:two-component system, HptB-dependent secretion and biofilm response regulator [Campylobacterota bacterium]
MNLQIDVTLQKYLKSLTLLCVEDSKTTQLIYKSILEDLFKELIFADDGEEGYEKFSNYHIDIIISDYEMPLLNGIEMVKKIRQKNKNIPILLVSVIEDIDIIVQAMQLNINNFIKKPLDSGEILQGVLNVSKILLANHYIKTKEERHLKEIEEKNRYSAYQQELAFSKELNILRNDFYYQMVQRETNIILDFFYKPLDTLSGDAYSVRKIDDTNTFYLIVDGMGKGISASLSAMLMTAYINHIIDKTHNSFDLNTLIESSLEYIKPILLDEESLSVDFVLFDYANHYMQYAKFSMPPMLIQTTDMQILKIKSNNPPISKYIQKFTISTFPTKDATKLLLYSDGLTENSTTIDNRLYMNFLENDFLHSYTKEDMVENLQSKIDKQEDDITFIFINKLDLAQNSQFEKAFNSTLDDVSLASDWYEELWEKLSQDFKIKTNANIVFTELFMNAYEHGNLGIYAEEKQELLENDTYFAKLEELEKNCTKKIVVNVSYIEYFENSYVVTQIVDEGSGFDTQILSNIFKKSGSFNGRGVFISKKLSQGIYYNKTGNSVIFFYKV